MSSTGKSKIQEIICVLVTSTAEIGDRMKNLPYRTVFIRLVQSEQGSGKQQQ